MLSEGERVGVNLLVGGYGSAGVQPFDKLSNRRSAHEFRCRPPAVF